MSTLQRGSIVAHRGHTAVVWTAWPEQLLVLPVVHEPATYSADVPIIALDDRLTLGVKADGVIRAGEPITVPRDGQEHRGELSGQAQCQMSVAVVRAAREAASAARWESERIHRRRAFDERTAVR